MLALFLAACAPKSLIARVSLSRDTISPNGDGVNDSVTIAYGLTRDAKVTIKFIDAEGKQYYFRRDEPRSDGDYLAPFKGTYAPDETKPNRRVMPNGTYTCVVSAEDNQGRREEVQRALTIEEADVAAPIITDVVCLPCSISPNKDAVDDEATISYRLTKGATVRLFATDQGGNQYLMEAPNRKPAALHSHRWDGTSGGALIPDGPYTVHLRAEDEAGNISESTIDMVLNAGGTPRLDVVEARFYPLSLPVGGELNVELRVKNTGSTILRTMGPPPGTPYTTDMTFNAFKDPQNPDGPPLFFERAGYWRVGVQWGLAGNLYPIRWGLGKDLEPGEEAVITGTIKVLIDRTREVYFWAGVVQEGIGFPGDRVGLQRIIISY